MGDTQFFIGGYYEERSGQDSSQYNVAASDGLTYFNATSNLWSNDTIPTNVKGNSDELDGEWVLATGVPTFGPEGLLLMIRPSADSFVNPTSLDNITIYEPVSKKYYFQTAGGPDIPQSRAHSCWVGMVGDNGTYEM